MKKPAVTQDIDVFYCEIVRMLQLAAEKTVPKRKTNFYKYWWDQELDLLKEQSIQAHQVWSQAGRARHVDIFNEMKKCKLSYKHAIRTKEHQSQQHFSDALNDALLSKDINSFWKSWRSKFNRNKRRCAEVIDGEHEPLHIAGRFAGIF